MQRGTSLFCYMERRSLRQLPENKETLPPPGGTPDSRNGKNWERDLRVEWRIAHPEPRPEMLREQFDRWPVHLQVALRQVLHGFYEHPLAVYICLIVLPFALDALRIRPRRNDQH